MFIDEASGRLGVGTAEPVDDLDVAGSMRVLGGSSPIRFTSEWIENGADDADANPQALKDGWSKKV